MSFLVASGSWSTLWCWDLGLSPIRLFLFSSPRSIADMISETSDAPAASSSPIKTLVILVQENRSFDHMLGWMKSLNPEINGVTGTESNLISTCDPNSTRLYFTANSSYVDPDPGHAIKSIYEQVFGKPWSKSNLNPQPTMDGFAQSAERKRKGRSKTVMRGFKPEALPVFKELVSEFAVCDRWFSSLPTSTQPNRLYLHSATSSGATSNIDPKQLLEGYPQKTIFESLEEEGFSFGIYFQSIPTTLFYRNLRKLKYRDNFQRFDLLFKKHCKDGSLPNYVVIEQRYYDLPSLAANDDHPPHDILDGQKFIKEVYEALRSSPQWNEILFLVTYDEHGGFYDHVPTPVTGVPSPDDIVGPEPYNFKFDRLGVRVPCILISPWIERGTVLHGPSGPYASSEFEHSSIPATVKKIFNLKEFLTKRDAWAGTFEVVLNRKEPRTDCPVTLPELVKLQDKEAKEEAKLSEFQEELVHLAAALNGDYKKSISPSKLVENLTVYEAGKYVEDAIKTFCLECEKSKGNGIDESDIVVASKPL